jgi:anti-anti-sigma regulatory factor
VPNLDAAGIGELVHLYNMAAAAHSALRIANARPRIRELLDRVGLFDLLSGDARRWWPQAV